MSLGSSLPLPLLAALAMRAACADVAADAGSTVELTCGTALPLSAQSSATLAARALSSVQSSEYNSLSPLWSFPVSELEAEYRQALASQHLRVMFDRVKAAESRSGSLRIHEIIIRLGPEAQPSAFPDRFVDSIFTIDDKGALVGYALYSGSQLVELYRAVLQATGSENPCHLRISAGNFPAPQDSEQPGTRP
jgi:hypothetical protein